MTEKSLIKATNSPMNLGLDKVMLLMDKTYYINENCNSCGICSKVCPVNNIQMKDGKPIWLNNCENCLACYNWCPKKAIEGGVAQKGYYYRNSDIKVSEIINQSSID